MINRFMLEGYVAFDPRISYTRTENLKVANVRIGVRKNKEHTDFINIVAWEKVAEKFESYVHKGDLISVIGRVDPVKRQKDDFVYYENSLIVEEVNFLSKKQTSNKNIEPQSEDYGAIYSDFDYPSYV